MPRSRNRKPRRSKERSESGKKKADGRIVCALCGRTIKDTGEQPVIYSICATCKKLPHRNPRQTMSLY
ncbi:MAG TPA: hypothetical protein VNX27_11220 [Chthoniobacterales bacterium]|nr:hypothetical protein [Chthoniobacterales bacterium]